MSSIAPPAHNRGAHTTDEWITPRWLIDRLRPFDLDPCACSNAPWFCAERNFSLPTNGLAHDWSVGGNDRPFVWMNPPYGAKTHLWLGRMALHGHGIALVFARTETRMFFRHVWPHASALLFLRGRLTFCRPNGELSKVGHNSGGPSVLIAYGEMARIRLESCADLGAFVLINSSLDPGPSQNRQGTQMPENRRNLKPYARH